MSAAAAMGSVGNGGDNPSEEKQSGAGILFVPPEIKFTGLFIHGRFVDAVSGAHLASLAPAILLCIPFGQSFFPFQFLPSLARSSSKDLLTGLP